MSTIPAVYTALQDLLTAAVEPLGVQVVVGGRTAVTTLSSRVLIIGRLSGTRSAERQSGVPYGTFQDAYTVECVISVARPGPDEPTDLFVVADEIYEAVRVAIEDSEGLGVDGIFEALLTGEFSCESSADAHERSVAYSFGVDMLARD